jgi:SAM-dependent methyltransferase
MRGTARRCPCCGGGFRAFLPTVSGRPDAICPGCGSHERHRLFALGLRERADRVPAGARVLHFAPEAALRDALAAAGAAGPGYVSADVEPGVAMRVEDITKLSFSDESFDVVLCSHVLEHVPDDAAAMGEILRVLAPSGWAFMQVPLDPELAATVEDPALTDPGERIRRFGQDDHVRMYGRDYPERLAAAGFTVTRDTFARALAPDARSRAGVDPTEDLWICERPA